MAIASAATCHERRCEQLSRLPIPFSLHFREIVKKKGEKRQCNGELVVRFFDTVSNVVKVDISIRRITQFTGNHALS